MGIYEGLTDSPIAQLVRALARLHLVQSFRVTKGELRALAAKEKAAKEAAKA